MLDLSLTRKYHEELHHKRTYSKLVMPKNYQNKIINSRLKYVGQGLIVYKPLVGHKKSYKELIEKVGGNQSFLWDLLTIIYLSELGITYREGLLPLS